MADDSTSTNDDTTSDDTIDPAPDAASRAHEPGNPADQDQNSAQADDLDEPASDAGDPYAPPPTDPYEGAVPPGYDWPTHGGYLGCLLGTMAACAISGFLGGTWFAILAAPTWVRLTITLVVAVAVFVGLGRLGWVMGKRFYREYPQPVRGVAAAPLASETPRADASPRD